MLSQREIDKRSGHDGTFWKNVVKHDDKRWEWTGYQNTNHNTVDCQKYHYGEFELCTRQTANTSKPKRLIKTKMAHRIAVYLFYGFEVSSDYDVFPINGDHLDINPNNLMLRHKKSRKEISPSDFITESAK